MESGCCIMTQELLDEIIEKCRPYAERGVVASYIPELTKADGRKLGIAVADNSHGVLGSGDAGVKFTIQSVAKVFILTGALMESGLDMVSRKVSIEPTSSPFNSIINLGMKNYNKPLNPMINAGAIVSLTMVRGNNSYEKFENVLELARAVCANPEIGIDHDVYISEKATGARNRSLAYYMLSTGIINEDVEELLDAYFRVCSIQMDCRDLANSGLTFANNGFERISKKCLFSKEIARMVKATLTMCGMYDESGHVAVEVGLPSKSGVGGGILSIAPGKMGIGIYGPALNPKGTSIAGLEALKMLSDKLELSLF